MYVQIYRLAPNRSAIRKILFDLTLYLAKETVTKGPLTLKKIILPMFLSTLKNTVTKKVLTNDTNITRQHNALYYSMHKSLRLRNLLVPTIS